MPSAAIRVRRIQRMSAAASITIGLGPGAHIGDAGELVDVRTDPANGGEKSRKAFLVMCDPARPLERRCVEHRRFEIAADRKAAVFGARSEFGYFFGR